MADPEMQDVVCPNCGTSVPNGPTLNGQSVTMHYDMLGVPRARSSYVNSPHRSSWGTNPARPPEGIVIHYMAGTYEGSINWFKNPDSRVSAHFMMAKDGRWTQMVPLPDPDPDGPRDGRYTAWHCLGGNSRYIGIEHEGFGGVNDWTDDMLYTSAQMAAYLCSVYAIPIVGPPGPSGHREWFVGLGGHDNVPGNNHTDPGRNFPWERYISLVQWYSEGHLEAPSAPEYAAAQA